MRAKKPDATPALLDIILSVLGFVLLLVHDPSEGALIPRVDYVLEVSWPEGIAVDLDTYVLRPDDVVTYFGRKDTGHVSIDRDDLGRRNDPAPPNIEITSFRAPLDGRYYVSIHTYRVDGGVFDPSWQAHVTFKNKDGRVLWHTVLPMPSNRQEAPVMTFVLENGKLVSHRASNRYIVDMRTYRP